MVIPPNTKTCGGPRVGTRRVDVAGLFAPMSIFHPDSVSSIGSEYGWWQHAYQWSQGELVILRKEDRNGAPCCSTLTAARTLCYMS